MQSLCPYPLPFLDSNVNLFPLHSAKILKLTQVFLALTHLDSSCRCHRGRGIQWATSGHKFQVLVRAWKDNLSCSSRGHFWGLSQAAYGPLIPQEQVPNWICFFLPGCRSFSQNLAAAWWPCCLKYSWSLVRPAPAVCVQKSNTWSGFHVVHNSDSTRDWQGLFLQDASLYGLLSGFPWTSGFSVNPQGLPEHLVAPLEVPGRGDWSDHPQVHLPRPARPDRNWRQGLQAPGEEEALDSIEVTLSLWRPQEFRLLSPVFPWNDRPHTWQVKYLLSCVPKTGFLGGSDGKESACNAGDLCSIPGSGGCPEEENGYPLQCSCLACSRDWRDWRLQSMGSQRAGHDWVTKIAIWVPHVTVFCHIHKPPLLSLILYFSWNWLTFFFLL